MRVLTKEKSGVNAGRATGFPAPFRVRTWIAMLAVVTLTAVLPRHGQAGALEAATRDATALLAAGIARGLQRSPMLMIALAFALAVLALAAATALRRAIAGWARRPLDLPESARIVGTEGQRLPWRVMAIAGGRQQAEIGGEIVRIGRDPENDLVLDHLTVHRHHALIRRSEDHSLVLHDLTAGTGNAVLHNDRPVALAALADGDRITIGAIELVVQRGGPSRHPEPPPSTANARPINLEGEHPWPINFQSHLRPLPAQDASPGHFARPSSQPDARIPA